MSVVESSIVDYDVKAIFQTGQLAGQPSQAGQPELKGEMQL